MSATPGLPALPCQVCKRKLWANVGRAFDPPKSMTNVSHGPGLSAGLGLCGAGEWVFGGGEGEEALLQVQQHPCSLRCERP